MRREKKMPKVQRGKMRHHVLRLSGLNVFMSSGLEPVHSLGNIHAPFTATCASYILILVPKKLCESSGDNKNKAKSEFIICARNSFQVDESIVCIKLVF